MQPKTLVLFVHGFLGSESSFQNFPLDLVQSLRKTHKLTNIEARIFPFFSTKGSADKAVALLHNWLLLNASTPEYEAVILVGHSMGGLIASEVFRKLGQPKKIDLATATKQKIFSVASADVEVPDLEVKEESKEKAKKDDTNDEQPTQSSWFRGWWSSKSDDKITVADETLQSMPVENEPEDENEFVSTVLQEGEENAVVNIIAIISLDSPFFGVNSNVFTIAVGEQAAEVIASYVPEKHSTTVKSSIIYGSSLATSAVTTSVNAVAAIPQASVDVVKAIPQATSTVLGASVGAVKAIPQATSTVLGASVEVVKAVPQATVNVVKAIPSATSSAIGTVGSISMAAYNSVFSLFSGKTESVEVSTELVVDNQEAPASSSEDQGEGKREPKTETTLVPIPNDEGWSPLITMGLTTAVVACGAYYYTGSLMALGTMTFVRRAALAYAVTQGEHAIKRLQFLYPIWGESMQDLNQRVDSLIEATKTGTFLFKCYYIKLKTDESSPPRTFIAPPTTESIHFCPIGTDAENEIIAHMSMFSRNDNPGYYWDLVHKIGNDIQTIVKLFKFA